MSSPVKKFRFSYDAPNGTRVNVVDAGQPDELVLKGRKGVVLLHLERMDRNYWFLQVGDANISLHQRRDGSVSVGVLRGDFGPALGYTEYYGAGESFYHQHSRERKVKRRSRK